MVDISVARQAYSRLQISNIGLIRRGFNAADAMTKSKKCEALETMVSRGMLYHPVEEWILRCDVWRSREIEERECHTNSVSRGDGGELTCEGGDRTHDAQKDACSRDGEGSDGEARNYHGDGKRRRVS